MALAQGDLDLLEMLEREIERRERIKQYENDYLSFFQHYCAVRCEDATPDCHREWVALTTDKSQPVWQNDRGKRKKGFVLAAPRGHSKTTILTFGKTLWEICYKRTNFTILVGSSATAAAENVNDLRVELEQNELIKQDFGDLCGADLGFRWAQSDFVAVHRNPLTGAVEHTARVTAKSPGASMRGIKHLGKRPDRIRVDDLETDESVENVEQINKNHNWLNKAAIPALDPRRGEFEMVGTILHNDSVLARMLSPRYAEVYVQKVYRAYWDDEQGVRHYLWEERFTPDALEMEKRRLGSLAFNSEYLNNPVDPETRKFRPEWIRFYYERDLTFDGGVWYFKGRPLIIYQAVDPAVKEKEQSDYFTHITIGITEESDLLQRAVLALWPFKDRLDFPAQVQMVIQQANAYPSVQAIGVETVAYQAALKQELLRRELLPIREIEHNRGKRDKIARITALSPLVENGQFFLRAAEEGEAGDLDELNQVRVHHQFHDLYEDMIHFPLISYFDTLDGLEMAVSLGTQSESFGEYAPSAQRQQQDTRQSSFGEVGDDGPPTPPFLAEMGWTPGSGFGEWR